MAHAAPAESLHPGCARNHAGAVVLRASHQYPVINDDQRSVLFAAMLPCVLQLLLLSGCQCVTDELKELGDG